MIFISIEKTEIIKINHEHFNYFTMIYVSINSNILFPHVFLPSHFDEKCENMTSNKKRTTQCKEFCSKHWKCVHISNFSTCCSSDKVWISLYLNNILLFTLSTEIENTIILISEIKKKHCKRSELWQNGFSYNSASKQMKRSLMIIFGVLNMMGDKCGARSANPSSGAEITPSFWWGLCCLLLFTLFTMVLSVLSLTYEFEKPFGIVHLLFLYKSTESIVIWMLFL